MDTNGLPYLGNMNKTGSDPQFARMIPLRTAIDWRSTRADAQRSARAGMPLRSVIGQLCGHQAPVGQECDSCAKGNGPFVNCRVLFLPDPKQPSVQWSWACASCNFSSGANKCSFRPENNNPPAWLIALVGTLNPSNSLLKHPSVTAAIAAIPDLPGTGAAATAGPVTLKNKKGKGRADGKDRNKLAGGGGGDAGEGASGTGKKRKKGGDKGGGAGATKKAKTGDGSGGAGASGTKKKTYDPVPQRIDAAPVRGPSFNAVWYETPLAQPSIAHMTDTQGAVRTYADLKEVQERVEYDLRALKTVLLAKNLIEESEAEGDGSEAGDDGSEKGSATSSEGVFAGIE